MRAADASALLVLALAPACAPELDAPSSILTAPAVIAVVASPAELRPGLAAHYRAVIGGPGGEDGAAALRWAYCTTARPLGEEGPIAPACLGEAQVVLEGVGPVVTATLPADACRRFGPDPPPGDFRAQDPDASGGYYQPLLVRGLDTDVVFTHRIRCGLARAPAEVARAFERDYRDNAAPSIAELALDGDVVRLVLAADAQETYVVLPPGAEALETRAETLVVTWWASAGTLDAHRSEVAGGGAETRWSAPAGATLWAVVRDERGGVAVATVER